MTEQTEPTPIITVQEMITAYETTVADLENVAVKEQEEVYGLLSEDQRLKYYIVMKKWENTRIDLSNRASSLKASIQIAATQTVKGQRFMAVYSPGKRSVKADNVEGLGKKLSLDVIMYRKMFPGHALLLVIEAVISDILNLVSIGNPSVNIKEK